MSSSEFSQRLHGHAASPASAATSGSPHSRFIPREELSSFAAWTPGALSGDAAPSFSTLQRAPGAAAAPAPAAPDPAELLRAARSQGYQDGYRDGLVALEGFKQSFALQTTTQIATLLRSVGEQLDGLQHRMAASLAAAAVQLARQVVRSELATRPELIAGVAAEAVDTLLVSARHIDVRVHPDDHALVAQGAGEDITARGGRLFADVAVARGGCVVESDVGVIDAGIENRWHRAAAALGQDVAWAAPADGQPAG